MSEWTIRSNFLAKILFFSMFYICFLILKNDNLLIPSSLMSNVSESLMLLTKNERCEQIAQVANQKWATMSKSLRSLTKNEQIARFFDWIAHLLIFSQQRAISSENRWAYSQPWILESKTMATTHTFCHPDTLIFLLCCGGYLYFVYYCVDKYLEDHSVTNTR